MDFTQLNDGTLTTEQLDLQEMVHDFMEREMLPIAAECDLNGRFPMEVWKKACDMGLATLTMPEEYGGGGVSFMTEAIVCEEYGWGDAGFAGTIGAHGLGMKPLLIAGTKEQCGHFAEIANAGGLSAFTLTEPDAGSDAGAITTTARRVGDEYIINGRKCFATNAEYADIFTVFATVDRSLGLKGITAFTVDRDTPGLVVGKHEDKLGQRSSVTNDVSYEEMRIPVKNRIGEEGQGFGIGMKTLNIGRATCASAAAGLGRAALEHCVKYAQERVTMGKPIIKHQMVQAMLADMASMVEASRQFGWYAARLLDVDSPRAPMVGAMAKCLCTDMIMKVTTDAIQVMGGYGYSREYPVEKLFRDAKIFQIFEGTNQVQRTVIAGMLPKNI